MEVGLAAQRVLCTAAYLRLLYAELDTGYKCLQASTLSETVQAFYNMILAARANICSYSKL